MHAVNRAIVPRRWGRKRTTGQHSARSPMLAGTLRRNSGQDSWNLL